MAWSSGLLAGLGVLVFFREVLPWFLPVFGVVDVCLGQAFNYFSAGIACWNGVPTCYFFSCSSWGGFLFVPLSRVGCLQWFLPLVLSRGGAGCRFRLGGYAVVGGRDGEGRALLPSVSAFALL